MFGNDTKALDVVQLPQTDFDVLFFRNTFGKFWGYFFEIVWGGIWDMFDFFLEGFCKVFR